MSSELPDILLQNAEIKKLNDSRPELTFTFTPTPTGTLRQQTNQEDHNRRNAEIDAAIAALPERRALARSAAAEKLRSDLRTAAKTSALKQSFWKTARREQERER